MGPAAVTVANRADFFLPPDSPLAGRIWITDGAIPDPRRLTGAEAILVVNPPPLDPALLPADWPEGLCLILVAPKGTETAGPRSNTATPLAALLQSSADQLEAALDWLRLRESWTGFLDFDRRAWFARLMPKDLRDRFWIPGGDWDGYLYGYHHDERVWQFDDGYRRKDLKVLTLAESSALFLHLLEKLAGTADGPTKKRMLFERVFPFYAQRGNLDPRARFSWSCDAEGSELAEVRKSVVGDELPDRAADYALAICALSEVAACFTHSGVGELYGKLMSELVCLDADRVRVAPKMTPEQRLTLRRDRPDLYLHLDYRAPNQCLIATFDTLGAPDPGLLAGAENLLLRLQGESDLPLAKREHETTALAGTLCQHHTYDARWRGVREPLASARARGALALECARPFEYARDLNYWMAAVLTDWALFPEQARAEPTLQVDADDILAGLTHHLDEAPGDGYNLMLCLLAAAVETECLGSDRYRALLAERGVTPQLLAGHFAEPGYDPGQVHNYALCLAAGYAALDDTAARDAQTSAALEQALADGRHFFFDVHAQEPGPEGAILDTIALKLALCELYHIQTRGEPEHAQGQAAVYLNRARALGPTRVPARVLDLLQRLADGAAPLTRGDALVGIFSLPY